jgi:peptidoglycan/xylan/chitin deacetylase (PgdA/CDA1 family)
MIGDTGKIEVAVLAFHRIGRPPADGWDTWYYVPTETFIEQLTYLRDNGWNVIDCNAFLTGLSEPERLPERPALLTFDDGCRCVCDIALPILRQFGFPAVLFVPTDYIGKRSSFDAGVEPEEPMCDWDDLRQLDRHGVSIQSHGVSHYWFSLLESARQAHELAASKEALEEALGKPVKLFAYPYSDSGSDGEATDAMLACAGYRAAFLCGGGPSRNRLPLPDPFRIDRLAMYRDTDLENELGP